MLKWQYLHLVYSRVCMWNIFCVFPFLLSHCVYVCHFHFLALSHYTFTLPTHAPTNKLHLCLTYSLFEMLPSLAVCLSKMGIFFFFLILRSLCVEKNSLKHIQHIKVSLDNCQAESDSVFLNLWKADVFRNAVWAVEFGEHLIPGVEKLYVRQGAV